VFSAPHNPTEFCHDMHYYAHDLDEPMLPGDYRVCLECRHVYRTPQELEEAYDLAMASFTENGVKVLPPAGGIDCCPYCGHDF
jgi:hypothetical protein